MADISAPPPPYTESPLASAPAINTTSNAHAVIAQIHASAPEREALLKTLKETDHAPPALKQQEDLLKDLKARLTTVEKNLKKLETSRLKEFKEHEKYRDSVMMRFAYRATGRRDKFDERAAKEEREYHAALQQEHEAHEAKRGLEASIASSNEEIARLTAPSELNDATTRQLHQLYHDIFGGATQGFSDEDAKEAALSRAQSAHELASAELQVERETLDLLQQAHTFAKSCVQLCGDARDASRMDMFGGGSLFDAMERDSLHKAERSMHNMIRALDRAQHLNKAVKPVPVPDIAEGNLLSDVLFDNIFSDMKFHEKIKTSEMQAQATAKALKAEFDAGVMRREEKKGVAKQRAEELSQARVTLFDARHQAFEKTVQQGALCD